LLRRIVLNEMLGNPDINTHPIVESLTRRLSRRASRA
jgi:hypothetical protein